MSDDSEFNTDVDESVSPSKIRSRNKRRILGFYPRAGLQLVKLQARLESGSLMHLQKLGG